MRTTNFKRLGTKVSPLPRFVLLIAAEVLLAMIYVGGESPTPVPCSAPEYHEFDFWLGDWDSFDFATSTKNARIRVDLILDGCVIHENYQSTDGHNRESFSIYDASRKVWHQSWVTNRGQLLIIEGATYKTARWFSEARIALPPENNAMSAESGSPLKAASAKLRSLHSTAAKPGSRGSI